MRQFLAILQSGEAIGVLMDSSPMTDAQVAAFTAGALGVRRPSDLPGARLVLGAVSIVELVHRPWRLSAEGTLRAYPEVTYCRDVAA